MAKAKTNRVKSSSTKRIKTDKVFIKNRTRQKQVLQFEEKQIVLNGFGKTEVTEDFDTAEKMFAYWINKNIVELVKH